MKDERKKYYENYVSGFKDYISVVNENEFNSVRKHYDIKILPEIIKYGLNARILELGCGPGFTLEYLKERGFNNIKGIDISGQQIEKALKKNLDVEQKDVLEFLENSIYKFDIIIAFDFVEHFKKEEVQCLFHSIAYKIEKNGMLIIRTPNGEGLFPNHIIYGDLTHYTIFNPNSLLQILKLVGFSKINFIEDAPISKNLKGLVRSILWKLIKGVYHCIRIIEQGSTEKVITQAFYCFARK